MLKKKLKLTKNKSLSNKIVVSPMCQYSSINGAPSEWHYKHLSNLIISGASMLVIESTAVSKKGRITLKDLGLFNNFQEKKFKELIKFLKKIKNIPICLQISHSGRKGSCNVPWVNLGKPLKKKSWQTISSSNIKKDMNWPKPKSASYKEIKKIISQFTDTSLRAFRAGFDGVEIHMAHGYLIHQFLSPISNYRDDLYGGSLENRCRLAIDIIESIKKKIPKHKILGARITGSDHLKNGIDISESIFLSKKLENLKLNYLCISSGGIISKTNMKPENHAFRVELSKEIKKNTKKILIGSTGNLKNFKLINKYFKKKYFDLAFIGRPFLENPNWLYKELEKNEIPRPYLKAFRKIN